MLRCCSEIVFGVNPHSTAPSLLAGTIADLDIFQWIASYPFSIFKFGNASKCVYHNSTSLPLIRLCGLCGQNSQRNTLVFVI